MAQQEAPDGCCWSMKMSGSVPLDVEKRADATSGDVMASVFTQLRCHIVRLER